MAKLQFGSGADEIIFVPRGAVTITETTGANGTPNVTIDTTPETKNGFNSTAYTGGNALAVAVSGTASLTIGGPPIAEFSTGSAKLAEFRSVTVNLAAHSNLISTDEMAFGRLTVHGAKATDTLVGTSVFAGTAVTLDTNLAGTGTMVVQSIITGTGVTNGSAVINGRVGKGVTVSLTGNGNHGAEGGASLTLLKPTQFAGTVEFDPGQSFVDLKGLNADSYSMMGSVLSLYSADKLVDTLNINNLNNLGAGPVADPLSIEHNASGVLIATVGEDVRQTGGVGTQLSLHG